jgi:hypothetical protein
MSTPRTHDYGPGRRSLGHDYAIHQAIDGGKQIRVSGWGPLIGDRISKGDYVLLQQGERASRYQVVEIRYHSDPDDMWAAVLDFAPRTYASQTEKDAAR